MWREKATFFLKGNGCNWMMSIKKAIIWCITLDSEIYKVKFSFLKDKYIDNKNIKYFYLKNLRKLTW